MRGSRKLFAAHRLLNIGSDPFLDLVAAEERRMPEESSNGARDDAMSSGGDARP
jgi:hypothetical protein